MPRSFPDLGESVEQVEPETFKQRLDDGEQFTMIDTRKPDEYAAWKISHPNLTILNIPFMQFMDEDNEKPASTVPEEVPEDVPEGQLIISCGKGLSSTFVAELLTREGYDVLALTDGMEGWAEVYEQYSVPTNTADAEVIQFHRPSSGCLAHLFVAGEEAAVVDPLRAFADVYAEAAKAHGATLKYAIDTHVHADHISGVREVASDTDIEIVLPAGATDRGLAFDATLVEDGETLPLGDLEITAQALPGHTTEMMGFSFAGVLASGDTVFLDSVARTELEDEDKARNAASTLWETIQKLEALGDETIIAPTHADPATPPGDSHSFTATLGELRGQLSVFDESREEFVDRITSNLGSQPTNYEEIIEINLGRDSADSEESFELELGPNNCAVAD